MYELDANLDLSFLIGLTLTQVCVGEFQLQLHFHQDVNVSIEESIACITPSSRSRWGCEDSWTHASEGSDMKAVVALLAYLGKTTIALQRMGKSGIVLTFENGSALEIFGDNTHYESYQISHRGGMIVV
jgi:hypothetical protein